MSKTIYQHIVPQKNMDHEIKPVTRMNTLSRAQLYCQHCGKPIMRVDEDEGPESLKSLLRLR